MNTVVRCAALFTGLAAVIYTADYADMHCGTPDPKDYHGKPLVTARPPEYCPGFRLVSTSFPIAAKGHMPLTVRTYVPQ